MRRSFFLALAAALAACEAVPSIAFFDVDGSTDAAVADAGSSGDGSADGMGSDAPDGVADASGCPDTGPTPSVCCGSVACVGADCSPTNCAKCERDCAGALCCSKNSQVIQCRALAQGCP